MLLVHTKWSRPPSEGGCQQRQYYLFHEFCPCWTWIHSEVLVFYFHLYRLKKLKLKLGHPAWSVAFLSCFQTCTEFRIISGEAARVKDIVRVRRSAGSEDSPPVYERVCAENLLLRCACVKRKTAGTLGRQFSGFSNTPPLAFFLPIPSCKRLPDFSEILGLSWIALHLLRSIHIDDA